MAPLPTRIVVHPIVLLSTVDHYNRIARDRKGNKRVVGLLLGEFRRGTVDITNSFAGDVVDGLGETILIKLHTVPFDEDPKDPSIWFLDVNYLENMFGMLRKVNAGERIVGWYSTGPKVRGNDLAIHETIRQHVAEPVLVIVDVIPKDLELPTDGYVSIEVTDPDTRATVRRFKHVDTEVGALEAEEIGVEHLLRDVTEVNLTPITTQVIQKVNGTRGLLSRLDDIQRYVDSLCIGVRKRRPNHDIIHMLQNILNLLPDLSLEEAAAHHVQTNDTMLVVFVASLVRVVIALHDLIVNKMLNMDDEKTPDEAAEKRKKTDSSAASSAAAADSKGKDDVPSKK